MFENSELMLSKEEELEKILLEIIIVAANLIKNMNAVKHANSTRKGGKEIDEKKIRMLSAFF